MNVYDLENIGNVEKEREIKDTISEGKESLKDLNTDAQRRRHILNRIITTDGFGYSYSHQCNLVPIDEKSFYLIDLT